MQRTISCIIVKGLEVVQQAGRVQSIAPLWWRFTKWSIRDQLNVEPAADGFSIFSQRFDSGGMLATGGLQAGDRGCSRAHLFCDLSLRQTSASSRFQQLVQ